MYPVYYLVVLLSLIYVLYHYQNNLIASIIILIFYSGLASYPGKIVENPYKILVLTLTVYAAIKYQPFKIAEKKDRFVLVSFFLFSFNFFLSALLNQTNFILTLSQYGKFLNPLIILFIFKNLQQNQRLAFIKISLLLLLLLKIQILCSVVKFLTLGMPETTVGTIAYEGGGVATVVPLLGFILTWIIKAGNLNRKDWYFVLLLIIIAVVSIKRAIWFMMPMMIFLFLFYVPKKKLPSSIAWVILLIPVIFYIGARVNPTLNKEHKTWGSFDIEFVANYVIEYNFGKTVGKNEEKKSGEGRGGATVLLFNKIMNPSVLTRQDIFGYGLEELVTKDYESFDVKKFGLNGKGAVTGFFSTYISFGLVGVVLFLIYALTIIDYIKIKRIKYVVIGLFIWEYFFYIGMLFTIPALAITFLYSVVYLSKYYTIPSLPRITLNQKSIFAR